MKKGMHHGHTTQQIKIHRLHGTALTLMEPDSSGEEKGMDPSFHAVRPGAVAVPGIGLPRSDTFNELNTIVDEDQEERTDDSLLMVVTGQVVETKTQVVVDAEFVSNSNQKTCALRQWVWAIVLVAVIFLGGWAALFVFLVRPQEDVVGTCSVVMG
jgi:hypothetical protein